MSVRQVFYFSVYAVTIVSALMMTVAEGSTRPGFITIPLAIVVWFAATRGRDIALPTFVVNLLGLLAFGAATFEFFSGRQEARLLSGAHLIVYLTWIVLVQRKNRQQYWWLCALGVLQVAVASVLTKDGWFGAALLSYLILLVWTLSVFSLFEAKIRFDPEIGRSPLLPAETPEQHAIPVPARLHAAASQARDAVQIDPDEPWISRRFALGVAATIVGSLFVGSVVFAVTPRHWLSGNIFDDTIERAERRRRFREIASLTAIDGLDSDEPVFDMRLIDDRVDEVVSVTDYEAYLGVGELYFRGNAMLIYRSGRWLRLGQLRHTEPNFKKTGRFREPGSERYLRHEYRLESYEGRNLFVLWPSQTGFLNGKEHPLDRSERDRTVWIRDLGSRLGGQPVDYTMFTSRADLSSPGHPVDAINGDFRAFLDFPRNLERLREKAREVAGTDWAAPNQYREVTERVRDWLAEGEFLYSLEPPGPSDESIDPVEAFLFEHKQGHCQYFATAMTLMLRAVGVKAIMVTGYKGGYANELINRLQVQGRHAHAWVEVPIDGKWRLFEPTPVVQEVVVDSMDPQSLWSDIATSFKDFWRGGVLSLNYSKQRRLFFQPFADWWKQFKRRHLGPDANFTSIARALGRFLSNPEKWFSWQGGVIVFCTLTFISLIVRAFPSSWVAKLLKRLFGKVTARVDRQRMVVEFYERFREICAAQGLERHPEQTQLEFAQIARDHFASRLQSAGLSDFPHQLASTFYDIRFGRRKVADAQLAGIRTGLKDMEQCLKE